MNRIFAALAILSLAPAALAQDASSPTAPTDPQAPAAPAATQAPPSDDGSVVSGRVDALAEQYAETRTDVAGLKRLKISGYIQPRFAWREDARFSAGAPTQDGFYVRRGRFKAVYDADFSQFVLQLDATPNGVGIKEGYAELKLPTKAVKGLTAAVDAGLQLFPFGYEVGVRSSSDLDVLERSLGSTTWLKGEYDIGVAVRAAYGPLVAKVGVFNGNGIDGGGGKDNDPLKDLIGRVGFDLGMVTGGVSGWFGKGQDFTAAGERRFDRRRFGADLQVFLDLIPVGGTAVKGEYIWGKTAIGTGAGGGGDSLDVKGFGWYALVTQNVGPFDQLAVRYQQLEPDSGIDRDLPANQGKVFVQDEISGALHHFVGGNLKLSVAYFHPMSRTRGDTAPSDPKKDSFVAQLQAKF